MRLFAKKEVVEVKLCEDIGLSGWYRCRRPAAYECANCGIALCVVDAQVNSEARTGRERLKRYCAVCMKNGLLG